jgi:hypothetical protein
MGANLIVTEASTAGAVVYWTLQGAIDHAKLVAAWKDAGLDPDDLVAPPSAVMALQRAVRQFASKRVLARSITQGHWALVDEQVVGDKLVYTDLLNAKLDTAAETLTLTPDHGGVRAAYDVHRTVVETRDVSNWLAGICEDLGGVTLRNTGGIYFLPPAALEKFRKIIAVLAQVSAHTIHRIPAMKCEEAVAAVLKAVEDEAKDAAEALDADLADTELGHKALTGRAAKAEKVKAKLVAYEELLGKEMTVLKDKLEDLRANLAAAALVAEAAAEEAKAA